jgi:adenine/guanine phosphoribosyltransferase-like PRPP-binding protein
MSDEVRRYLAGFTSSLETQPADVKSDPQILGLRAALSAELESGPTCVVDFGMGSGILASQLQTLPPFEQHSSRYWGIDLQLSSDPLRVAGLDSGWLSSGRASFCQLKDMNRLLEEVQLDRILIVARNVGHELDPSGWLALLKLVLEHPASTVSLLWQDMSRLPSAEIGNAPWSEQQLVELFSELDLKVHSPVSDESRSGIPWYTLIARRVITRSCDSRAIIRLLRRLRRAHLDELTRQPIPSGEADITTLRRQSDVFSIHLWLRKCDILLETMIHNEEDLGEDQKIVNVHWAELIAGIDRFVGSADGFDLLIGIARGGLPLATALSARFDRCGFGVYARRYLDEAATRPFAVFDGSSMARRARVKIEDGLLLPAIFQKPDMRVLVVDDVTTFGNTLEGVTDSIHKRLGSAVQVSYYVHAVDLDRLSASKPQICRRLQYSEVINNRKTWLRFPWECGWTARML